MNDRYLFKAKRIDNGEWIQGYLYCIWERAYICWGMINNIPDMREVDPSTICQCTGISDKKGKLIWENDILMCHGNSKDLAKAVFGEFYVINVETLEKVDKVIGWHYEVITTDELSKYEPFCLPMPLTDYYIKKCEMELIGNIFDNHELLKGEIKNEK